MKTILFVNDSPFICDVYSCILERDGYRPIVAYGGEECLEILKKTIPDLIFIDVRMEFGIDGWETLEEIKTNPATTDIPVIMCSGSQLNKRESIFMEDWLTLPVSHNELLDVLEKVFNRQEKSKENPASHLKE